VSFRGCILMGAPGSGKGTQAKRLSKDWAVPHISTGDMLRSEVSEGTELGVEVQSIIESGQLIGDDLMTSILKRRFGQADVKSGFILDGYPRTIAQGESLFELLKGLGLPSPRVVLLELDSESLVKRVVGRLTCRECGAIYHREHNPPQGGQCSVCGSPDLVAREDDSEETVAKRLSVYEEQTAPLIEFFEGRTKVLRFSAAKPVEALTAEIEAAFG